MPRRSTEQLGRMRRASRIKVLRQRLGMTQAEIAEAFLPVTTLHDREQRRTTPDAPARALLLAEAPGTIDCLGCEDCGYR